MIPKTIQARLAFSHLLVSLISIALISIYAGNVLLRAVRDEEEHHYEDLAFAASNALEGPLSRYISGEDTRAEMQSIVTGILGSQHGLHYLIYLPTGEAVFDSEGPAVLQAASESDTEFWKALNDPIGEWEEFRPNSTGVETLYLAVRIEHEEDVFGVLRLEVPVQLVLDSARRSLGFLVATALIVALGMGAVGYFLSRSLADPILNMTSAAKFISHGELGARVETLTELHEIQELAQSFNDMAARLQDHVDQLRTFVANASHELRTPLTSIKLRVEALQNGALDDPPVTERFLSEIESEVDRLVRMVNDLLDLSRIEAGLEATSRSPVDLSAIIREATETFTARAERSGLKLTSRISAKKRRVLGNEDQLRRMLYNLVDNAIKYTPHGGSVELLLDDGQAPATVKLCVRDSGFGIASYQLPHVFERFYRVEATRPRNGPPQGSGLGLSIAKSIAEMHDGQIGVTSQLGKGSTFWVEFPIYQGK